MKQTLNIAPIYRNVPTGRVDEEARTVELAFSSEAPAPQVYGFERVMEVLDHGPGAVDLAKLNAGAPVLVNHRDDIHVGVVESARIDSDRRGRAVIRFGRSEEASRYFQDVVDGIRTGVSVGYRVYKVAEKTAEGIVRALSWQPFEISLASVAADPLNTGIGRSSDQEPNDCEVIAMNDDDKKPDDKQVTETKTRKQTADERSAYQVDLMASERESAISDERERAGHIQLLGRKFGCENLAAEFVRNGKSVAEFQRHVVESQSGESNGQPLISMSGARPTADHKLDMERKQVENYSFMRAINALGNPLDQKAQRAAAFELECSDAAIAKCGRSVSGIMVPEDMLTAPRLDGRRTMVTTSAASAGNLVGTDLLAGNFIDVLRNTSAVAGMGARVLENLQGDVAVPRKTASVTAEWLATENTAITETVLTTDLVSLTPKEIGARAHFSRRQMLQSSVGMEQLTRDDIAETIGVGWDLAALYGTGAAGQPTGIANTSGIGAPTAFAAAVPTWAEVVAMIGNVATNNALMGSLGYIIEGAMMASLMATSKDAGSGQFVYQGGSIGDYRAPFSNQVTSGDVFFGNWSDLFIAIWGGGLNLIVDPYTLAHQSEIRVIGSLPVDFGVRHPESFALNNDGV